MSAQQDAVKECNLALKELEEYIRWLKTKKKSYIETPRIKSKPDDTFLYE